MYSSTKQEYIKKSRLQKKRAIILLSAGVIAYVGMELMLQGDFIESNIWGTNPINGNREAFAG